MGAPAASEDLDSSKAKSTGTWQGAAARGGSKLPPRPPLPRGAPSGGRDGGGRRVLSQSKGRAGLRGRGGARNAMQPGVGGRGFCPGRRQMLRFRFAVSLVLVHAEERGARRVGTAVGCLRAPAGPLGVCGEKRGVVPAGTKQQSQQPKSRRGESEGSPRALTQSVTNPTRAGPRFSCKTPRDRAGFCFGHPF